MLTEHLPEISIVGGSRAIWKSRDCVGDLKSRWHQARGFYICLYKVLRPDYTNWHLIPAMHTKDEQGMIWW
jgi:hypothetical protein